MSSNRNEERIDFAELIKSTDKECERFGEAYGRLKMLFELVKEGLVSVPQASSKVNMTETQFVIEMGKAERDICFYEQMRTIIGLLHDDDTENPKYIPGDILEQIKNKILQSFEEGKLYEILQEEMRLNIRLKNLREAKEDIEFRIKTTAGIEKGT